MTESDWTTLLETAKANTDTTWILRPQESPATAPIPQSQSQVSSEQEIPVLLYRDSNSWCPHCEKVLFALEEKEIPYQVDFINLRSKPQWYVDLVPTGLVPAAKIQGSLIYESNDILLALEDKFLPSLLPKDPTLNKAARKIVVNSQSPSLIEVGYKFIFAGSNLSSTDSSPELLLSLQTELEKELAEFEKILAKYPGDYFFGEFSLVDIIYAPHLQRIASSLPIYHNYHILGNEKFPHLNSWLKAIDSRPTYTRIKTGSKTVNLVFRRIFGLQPYTEEFSPATENLPCNSYKMEAAAKLSDNHVAIINDIVRNSGIEAFLDEDNQGEIKSSIDQHLRWLAEYLIFGNEQPLIGGRVGRKSTTKPEIAAIGAIALAYLRNRVSAPRDMSANAAISFRSAIDTLMQALY